MMRLKFCWAGVALALGVVGCDREAGLGRRLEAGTRHLAAGDLAAAEIEFKNVLQKEPRHAGATAGLGSVALARGAVYEAARWLAVAKAAEPRNVAVRADLVRALLALGFFADARIEIDLMLSELAPHDGELWLLRAESALEPDDVEAVLGRLREVAEPAGGAGCLAEALLRLRLRSWAEADAAMDRAAGIDGETPRLCGLRAARYWAAGDREQAEQWFRKAVEMAGPRAPEPLIFARFLRETGRQEQAVELLERLAAETPDFVPAWRMLAQIAAGSGDAKRTGDMLDRLFALTALDLEAGLLRAELWLRQGKAKQAVELIEKMAAALGTRPALDLNLARARLAVGDVPGAEGALERILEARPGEPAAVLMQARIDLLQGKADKVVADMQAFLGNHPEHSQAELVLVDALRLTGRPDEAAKILQAIAARQPQEFAPWFFLGLTLRSAERPAEAREAFERAAQLDPSSLAVLAQLVELDLAEGAADAARVRIDHQLELDPDSARARYLSARWFEQQGRFKEAADELSAALASEPDLLPVHHALVRVRVAAGDGPGVLAGLRELVGKAPQDISAWMQLGLLCQQIGEPAEARAAYERILEVSPEFVPALNNLALLLSDEPEGLEKARDLVLRARAKAPDDPAVKDTTGWVEFRRGNYREALTLLRDAAAGLPDHPEVLAHLGQAAYMMGDEEQARETLRRALAGDAGFAGRDTAAAWFARLDEPPADWAAEEQIKTFEDRVDDDPRDVVSWLRLGRTRAAAGHAAEARAAFEQALEINLSIATAWAAVAALDAGPLAMPERALEAAAKARDLAPHDPQLAAVIGRAALVAGNHEWAYSLLSEAALHTAVTPEISRDLALAAFSIGRIDEARTTMERASKAAGDDSLAAEAREFLVLTAPGFPTHADAAEWIDRWSTRHPGHPVGRYAAARLAEHEGRTADAAAAFEELLERAPRMTPARIGLARVCLADPARLDTAAAAARQARDEAPNDPEAASVLARALFRQGDFERAVSLLAAVSAQRELTADESFAFGMSLGETNDPPKARTFLEAALAGGLQGADAAAARATLATLETTEDQ